jgi:hypothetical protein
MNLTKKTLRSQKFPTKARNHHPEACHEHDR